MNIKRKKDSSKLFVTVNGRIDTVTAPEFEAGVKPYLDGVTDLTIDFKEVTAFTPEEDDGSGRDEACQRQRGCKRRI